jgi:hypothetical protein
MESVYCAVRTGSLNKTLRIVLEGFKTSSLVAIAFSYSHLMQGKDAWFPASLLPAAEFL